MTPPPPRRGPRPLMLHLAMDQGLRGLQPGATMLSALFPFASATSNGASPGWNPAATMGILPDAALIAGIAAYRRHPYHRALSDPPVLWSEEETRLLDYAPGSDAPPVLFVPSLINRATVLDLAEGNSVVRFMAASGLRPLLLDWGWPGPIERRFTLTDYIAGRLERAIAAVGQKVTLAGYCMGGMLALAAALRRPDLVRALALLATPWDFHAEDAARAKSVAAMLPLFEPLMAATSTLPIDALQTLFALLEPGAVPDKYRAFAGMDQESDRARLFVALEDWVNDGVPLGAPVARECLGQWYGANAPARLEWRIAGAVVDPATLTCPSFAAVPARDRIVPPESALALARALPGAVLHQPGAGHIGMAAGPRAESTLLRPLAAWLLAQQDGSRIASLAQRRRAGGKRGNVDGKRGNAAGSMPGGAVQS